MMLRMFFLALVSLAALSAPAFAQSPLKLAAGDASIKFGFLFQPQFEAAGNATKDGTSQNLFLRRARFLMGGNLTKDVEFFFETDSANLGKQDSAATTTTAKNTSSIIVQDAFISWKALPNLRLDAGLVLVPFAHQSTQGATSLLTWDYSPYAFLQSSLLGSNAGRDTGVMARGQVDKWLEFRIGAFQGKRTAAINAPVAPEAQRPASNNALRTAGRLQFNLFDAEGGTFLSGTYHGAKKILSFGIAHDRQDDYKATAFDVFFDWPIGKDVLTFQADHYSWDGGTWIALPKQKNLFVEAAYRFGSVNVSPMLRYETRRPETATVALPDENRSGIGLVWWIQGHTNNLKLFYTRVKPSAPSHLPGAAALKSYDQVNLQWQVFLF